MALAIDIKNKGVKISYNGMCWRKELGECGEEEHSRGVFLYLAKMYCKLSYVTVVLNRFLGKSRQISPNSALIRPRPLPSKSFMIYQ
jgi:hypothetical protein